MVKSGGFFFAIAAIVMVFIVWGNPIPEIATALLPAPPAPLPSSTLSLAEDFDLTVDEQNLMAHVQALAEPAATPAQRAVARQYISEQLSEYGLTATQQSYTTETTAGVNLIAEIAGSDSTAGSIVLGAHYDTEVNSPGADDNGSGVATLLEAARIFTSQTEAQNIEALPRSLKLVFFDQEERQADGSGLLGSLAFADSDNIEDVKGAVILDMVGYACRTPGCQSYPAQLPLSDLPDTGDFLAVIGLQKYADVIGAFVLSAQTTWPRVFTLPLPEPTLRLFPDLLRSDHAPFWERNVPAVFISDTANFRNPNYHTPQDTPDTLDPSFFRGSAQHVVNAIAALLSQT